MHKDEHWTEQYFDVANDDDKCREKFEEWNQDKLWARVDYITGEALLRVKGVEQGPGMDAYRRLH